MATVVHIEAANVENIDFKRLKKTFHTNFLLLKWQNETKVYVILNLLEVFANYLKEMFYEVSSDDFIKHRRHFNVFLSLDSHTFLCHQDNLYNMVKLLHKGISENTYVTAFMRFNNSSLSFKTEKRNKNDDEKYQLFAAKLYYEMERCKRLCGTGKYKSMCIAHSTNEKIKTCSLYKLDDSPYTKYATPVCRKSYSKKKALAPRKSEDSQIVLKPRCIVEYVTHKFEHIKSFDFDAVPGVPRTQEVNLTCVRPLDDMFPNFPSVPDYSQANGDTGIPSPRSANVHENNARSNIQFRSHVDELYSNDSTNSHSGNNLVPMDIEEYGHSSNLGQAINQDGISRNILTFNVSQNDSRSEICIDGSSYHPTGQLHFSGRNFDTDLRLPPPAVVQQHRTFPMGHIGGNTLGQQQQYQQHNREKTSSGKRQAIPQQRNGNDDLVRHLGRVRSPEYADLTDRLATFTRWPSDIAQTSARVAEAGFYYTGFQDTVRCFVCDGGLKNWDPDDDPWIEHARWFPQCAFVRHIKGEEFINLVRMSTEESDEEDDHTVHAGATWGGANNSNASADSASHEITEPSVLECKDAQFVIEMGFSTKVVAMAINDIFKKGKEDFTSQEITDIILEKDMLEEPSTSILAVDCPATIENVSPTGHAMFENKRLKELLQCTECKTKERNILFLPCTHHVVCELCSRDLHICTYCYRKIKDKVRTYMS
ncbi:hypothetical protein ACJMK2_029479 [Sinanodonta woodiana]|uniref:Uncharacterized protein n=1 Tax=Sinanodonta woodiana TaxID=1069815 RepID=A0ABD3XCM8_SINWO